LREKHLTSVRSFTVTGNSVTAFVCVIRMLGSMDRQFLHKLSLQLEYIFALFVQESQSAICFTYLHKLYLTQKNALSLFRQHDCRSGSLICELQCRMDFELILQSQSQYLCHRFTALLHHIVLMCDWTIFQFINLFLQELNFFLQNCHRVAILVCPALFCLIMQSTCIDAVHT